MKTKKMKVIMMTTYNQNEIAKIRSLLAQPFLKVVLG